jgi:tetratricopeptide (TPR) repeat protein
MKALILLLLTSSLFAQADLTVLTSKPAFSLTTRELRAAADKVPVNQEHEAVLLCNDRSYVISADQRITFRIHNVYRVNTAGGVPDWDSTEVHWQPWHEDKPELRARVISPDGTAHELDPKTVVDAAVKHGQEYGDEHTLRAPFPAVEAGSIVEEDIVVREHESLFREGRVRRVYFDSSVPVRQSRLTIEAPESVPLRYFNTKALGAVTPASSESGGVRRITFELGPREPSVEETSHLPFEVAAQPYISFSTAKDWQAVARGYAEIVERQLRGGNVAGIAKRASAGKSGRDQIAGALLAEVHKQVRYVAVELGDASIVPRDPGETLHRKYGDCKDQAALLVALLRASGIPSHVALLSSGNGHDVDEAQPGFGEFDHAIVWLEGEPGTFVDPTSEFSRFGELPISDQGRMALIARPQTTDLVRIPEAPSTENRGVETREVFLAESGKSRVVETTESWGSIENSDRDYYQSTSAEDTRKGLTQYVKSNYFSDDAPKIEIAPVSDLSKPFRLRLEMTNTRRGFTDTNTAVLAVPLADLVAKLPPIFSEEPKDTDKPRQEDFLLPQAFVAEWRYHVVAPPGFRPAALPQAGKQELGPAVLAKTFTIAPDGAVDATFRFDTVKRRLTPAELDSMRKAVREVRAGQATLIQFEQIGQALLAAGDVKGALAEFRKLVQLHPREELHHVQIANALLAAGAGMQARTEARAATGLDPRSVEAFASVGWISQHDAVGRRFKPGCDLAGAEKAYRTAIELDAANDTARENLAILLEHMPDGERYANKERLSAAIEEYKTIKGKLTGGLQYNLDFALFWAGRYGELRERAAPDHTPDGDKFYLAAVAAASGAKAAMEEGAQRVAGAQARQTALASAAQVLVAAGVYQPAADLLEALTPGASGAAQVRNLINGLRAAMKSAASGPQTPESALKQALTALITSENVKPEAFFSEASRPLAERFAQEARMGFAPMRQQLTKAGLTVRGVMEMALGIMPFALDGDDASGYRLSSEFGTQKIRAYMLTEGGKYLIRSVDRASVLGEEVLSRIEKGDLTGAKRWLDWAREEVQLGGGEDPLSGAAFPRLWSRKGAVDRAKMEVAAAVLASTPGKAEKSLAIVSKARESAASETERLNLDLGLREVYTDLDRGQELLAVAQRLLAQYPDSQTAIRTQLNALWLLKRFAEAAKVVDDRIAKSPSDTFLYTLGASIAQDGGDFARADELLNKLIATAKGGEGVQNSLAWSYLVQGKNLDEALDISSRSIAGGGNFATLHTLASIAAEIGKTAQARQVILQAMDSAGLNEPNEACWYVFGRLAEQYGLNDVARDYYKKVTRPGGERGLPVSTYALAQRRLAALQ